MNPTKQIDQYIASIPDWRGEILTKLRKLIHEAGPELKEEWKWGCPVWSQNGLVCSISAFKAHVGMNFFKGATLNDPQKLFTTGEGKSMRSIKWFESNKINESALKDLIKEAINFNSKKD